MQIATILKTSPVIPVIVIDEIEDALPLASALVKGGLRVLEITMRTPIALEALALIKAQVEGAIVGMGTVISDEHLDRAVAAGADFLVSPGVTPRLIDAAKNSSVPFLPGASGPTEAMRLFEGGFTSMKFFPAEAAGGVAMLQSISGPLPEITFCPTGGINMSNAGQYLNLPNVACVGGSWMVKPEMLRNGEWLQIEILAKQASELSRLAHLL